MLNRHLRTLAPGFKSLNANPFYSECRNVGFVSNDEYAYALFEWRENGVYYAHLLCDWPWRGKRAIAFGCEAVCRVFTDHSARVIFAVIPRENLASRIVCRAIGGTPFADTADMFGRPCKVYRLGRGQWERSSAVLLKA